jgi:hypothetical protein
MSEESFPSGPWAGFYSYSGEPDRHRMRLSLTFTKGMIRGEGDDCIGPFIISGRYDATVGECHWTKSYVRKHDVFYQGFREGKFIWGTWEIREECGGFKIWPAAYGGGDNDAESEKKEEVEPADAVGEVVGAGAIDTFSGR